MRQLLDRLDVVADDAAQRISVRPLDEVRRSRYRHRRRLRSAVAGVALVGAATAITVIATDHTKTVSVSVSNGGSTPETGSTADASARALITRAAQPGQLPDGIEGQLAISPPPVKVYIKRITWSEFVYRSGFAGPDFSNVAFGSGYPSADTEVYLALENGRFQQASEGGESSSSWVEVVRLTKPPYHMIAETGWNGTSSPPQWFKSLPDHR